jgi:hypothetical protein
MTGPPTKLIFIALVSMVLLGGSVLSNLVNGPSRSTETASSTSSTSSEPSPGFESWPKSDKPYTPF